MDDVGRVVRFHILGHKSRFKHIQRTRNESSDNGRNCATRRIIGALAKLKVVLLPQKLEYRKLKARENDVSGQSRPIPYVKPSQSLHFSDLPQGVHYVLRTTHHQLLLYHFERVPHQIACHFGTDWSNHIFDGVVRYAGPDGLIGEEKWEGVGEGDDHLAWKPLELTSGNWGQIFARGRAHDLRLDSLQGVKKGIDGYARHPASNPVLQIRHNYNSHNTHQYSRDRTCPNFHRQLLKQLFSLALRLLY